ncbi:alpha/beta hydrolase family protein [Apilactobacillus timberlakei]|uniref:alpha/beta hydrolase family protein n=1 Tax=Apilactobacillus timberlakei TaxID=2008380 RepID=UPI00112C363C|nr:alpha/beta hydrolase [Apilactobacillus timberlakei]TPR19291.1 alpha/beta hydrolase [Apilactobacillus timberlakei]
MKFFNDNEAFNFETIRALGYANYLGSSYGEVNEIVKKIDSKSTDSWFNEWNSMAQLLNKNASEQIQNNHIASAYKTLLRVSNYYRSAEFFLDPYDNRRIKVYLDSVDAFQKAMRISKYDVSILNIPFDGYYMNGYLFKSKYENAPTLIYVGGYDSTCEELYFSGGAEAIERDYNVLIFDGPGQGGVLRKYDKKTISNYEKPLAAAIDYLDNYTDININNFIGLMGMSLGGNYVARAAAFEKRINAVIMYDIFTNPYQSIIEKNREVEKLLALSTKEVLQKIEEKPMIIQWMIKNFLWVFDGKNISEKVNNLKNMDVSKISSKIGVPSLLLFGEDDIFVSKQQLDNQVKYMNSKLVTVRKFDNTFGAQYHCQVGNVNILLSTVFDWLEEVMNNENS